MVAAAEVVVAAEVDFIVVEDIMEVREDLNVLEIVLKS